MIYRYLIFILCLSFHVNATEVHVWKSEPINLSFEVGKQRIITLPSHSKMAVSPQVSGKVEVVPANGAIYFTALDVFDAASAKIKLIETGQEIRLNIEAVPATNVPVEHVEIQLWSKHKKEDISVVNSAPKATIPNFMRKPPLTTAGIFRFASQYVWAEERLKPAQPAQVSLVNINGQLNLTNLMGFCSLGKFSYGVHKAFKVNDGRYFTIIALKNRTNKKAYINLTHLNVQHNGVAVQHLYVTPKGTAGELTTMTLITDQPFESALMSKPYIFTEFGTEVGCS